MTPEQARQVQLSAAAAAAHLRGNTSDCYTLMQDQGDPSTNADSLVMLVKAVVGIAANLAKTEPLTVLAELQPADERLLPILADHAAARGSSRRLWRTDRLLTCTLTSRLS